MIVNGFHIKQDINGHDYIKTVNPDCNNETAGDILESFNLFNERPYTRL
jgi:hypothetical protein